MVLIYLFFITLLIVISFFLFWRYVFFIRIPKRTISSDENAVLSPADGFVCYCKKIQPGEEVFSIKKNKMIHLNDLMFIDDEDIFQKPGWLIGIMMTVFDVHYNLAPINGYITKICHDFPTKNRRNNSMLPVEINLLLNHKPFINDVSYLISNERASYIIKNKDISLYVTQIADSWVKKIVTIKNNQMIDQGEIFGMIKMGSQVDVFIPDEHEDYHVSIKNRQRVKAGVTKLLKKKNG